MLETVSAALSPCARLDGIEGHLDGAVALGVDSDLPAIRLGAAHQRCELLRVVVEEPASSWFSPYGVRKQAVLPLSAPSE